VELTHIRCFVAVAEERQFTAAAKRLGTAQSSVSWAIGRLESELGVVLFERTTRSVELTANGRALLPAARRVVGVLDVAIAALHAASDVSSTPAIRMH
jgi:DNA-binding transcriptional LysR family regulator